MQRDRGLALRFALGAMVAVSSVCVFWIATAWPNGATAALIAGVACALLGGLPGVAIRQFLRGFLVGLVAAAVYGFAIFPRVTDFVMLAVVLAPLLLLFGSMLARPTLAPFALGALLSFLYTLGLAPTYQSDFTSFINGAIGELIAVAAAVGAIDIFSVIGAEVAFARLLRAGFRDIAARAEGKAANTRQWIGRMIDRVALISRRSGPTGAHPPVSPYDPLVGMRIGYLAGELRALSCTLSESEEREATDEALSGISTHFRTLDPAEQMAAGEAVLHAIDRAIAAFSADPQPERRRHGAVLLTGLRRSLFPRAPAFQGTGE